MNAILHVCAKYGGPRSNIDCRVIRLYTELSDNLACTALEFFSICSLLGATSEVISAVVMRHSTTDKAVKFGDTGFYQSQDIQLTVDGGRQVDAFIAITPDPMV